MHAVVATVSVENPEAARALLAPERGPLVSRAPGLVAAYWLEPIDGIGMSITVFQSEADARAAAAYPEPPMEGVTLLTLTAREVLAYLEATH